MILPLCLMLYINTAYRHQHLMPDGTKVIHSHPIDSAGNKQAAKGHHHTCMELLSLSLVSDSALYLSSIDFNPFAGFYNISEINELREQSDLYRESVNTRLLRAPPCS
jgi:hypothetical protein